MQKVPGVTGVRVSLNEGLTVLDLKPGNSVTLLHLRQVIRNNGFVTKEAQIVARGAVTAAANELTFEVSGSKERLALSAKVSPTVDVVITGTVDLSDPKRLRLAVKSTGAP